MRLRPRWTRWITLGAALLLAGAWPVAARNARPQQSSPPRVVEVQYGDSLWTLAREHGDPHQDVRLVVAEMMRLNGITAGDLQPGQRVLVPAAR